jgi:glutamate carboxypeptidase
MSEADAVERVLGRVRAYVEQETPSGHAIELTRLSELIEAELIALGGIVDRVEAPGLGRNLRASFTGLDTSLSPLVLLAHIDTVHPIGTLERQPFRIHDGRAEGPGIYDMKTGLALLIEAIQLLTSRGSGPRRPLKFLVTCDEEIGSHSARPLIAECARDAAAALVPEPSMPDGSVKTARKGVLTYRLDVRGVAGHAGTEPGRASSAITEVAHQILRIIALADPARGTTVNVGTIRGGTASNVVAADAWATIDVRIAEPAEETRIEQALAALQPVLDRSRVSARLTESRGPLVRDDGVLKLYHHARAVAAELGVDLGEGATGGGSDGSLIAAFGVPTLDGIGPRGGGAHAADEHVIIDDLPFRLALIARLLETL